MVRFLGVSSLLFISYIAVVLAADSIPRMQASDPGVALLGRRKVCAVGQSESYYDVIQLKQLAYSLSAQLHALTIRAAAALVIIVAVTRRVDNSKSLVVLLTTGLRNYAEGADATKRWVSLRQHPLRNSVTQVT